MVIVNKIPAVVVACAIIFSGVVFCETIILKSGKEITGEISEKTDDYIKIKVQGINLTYYLDDVAYVQGQAGQLNEGENVTGGLFSANTTSDSVAGPADKRQILEFIGKLNAMADKKPVIIFNSMPEADKIEALKKMLKEVEDFPAPTGCDKLKYLFLQLDKKSLNARILVSQDKQETAEFKVLSKEIEELSRKYLEEKGVVASIAANMP